MLIRDDIFRTAIFRCSRNGVERTSVKMALVDSAAAFASHCDAIDSTGALKRLCIMAS